MREDGEQMREALKLRGFIPMKFQNFVKQNFQK